MNEAIYGIWNTTVGGDSQPSVTGLSVGDYGVGKEPAKAFDSIVSSKYLNFGRCNNTVGGGVLDCGTNTGLYLSLVRGSSLLLAFKFRTADSYPPRDPLLITVEGSNLPNASLIYGSSWTQIYAGSSGLDADPGRYTSGNLQWIPSNGIWYCSYRILITTKRDIGNFVHYSELELFGL